MLQHVFHSKMFSVSLVLGTLFFFNHLFAQQMINGRIIRTGIWKNQQIEYIDRQIAVKLKYGVQMHDVNATFNKFNGNLIESFDKLRWGLVEIPEGKDIFPIIDSLKNNSLIEAVEPNGVIHTSFNPNDTYFQDGHQWALKNVGQNPPSGTNHADINASEAWNITLGSSNIIIGVLDTGIPMLNGSLSHADLDDANKIILGEDEIGDGESVRDLFGHGTHVAGIAAVETNNSTGTAGVAGGCKLLICQVFNSSGGGTYTAFKNGVIYAVDNGANVINYSGRGTYGDQQLIDAIVYAQSNNVLIVAAAGNDNGAIGYPATYSSSYNNVISVGATDQNDQRASYSNYGSQLNVVAPGGYGGSFDANDIYSTTPNYSFTLESWYGVSENYGYLAGTSMAAPHVSGIAALMLSVNPSLTPSQIRTIIQLSADKVAGMSGQNFTNYYGYGRVNAYKAIKYTLENYGGTLAQSVTIPSG